MTGENGVKSLANLLASTILVNTIVMPCYIRQLECQEISFTLGGTFSYFGFNYAERLCLFFTTL